ncbi:MAG: peptidase S8 family protein, partial [Parvularculaceae bacterium]
MNPANRRVREEHGRRLANELDAAFAAMDQARPQDQRLPPIEGSFLEVELRAGAKVDDTLTHKREGIRPAAVKLEDDNKRTVALFVPDHARVAFKQILNDYRNGELTEIGGEPPKKGRVEPVEAFRRARLETFWTDDPAALPQDP